MQLLPSLALNGRRIDLQSLNMPAQLIILFLQLIYVPGQRLILGALVAVGHGSVRSQHYVEEQPDGERRGHNCPDLPAQTKRPVNHRLTFLGSLKHILPSPADVFTGFGKANGAITALCFFFLQSFPVRIGFRDAYSKIHCFADALNLSESACERASV